MRQFFCILVALLLSLDVHAGVTPIPLHGSARTVNVDSSASAALFVGIREFRDDETLSEVRYAVDDAVDLAFAFAIERPLIPPGRVILALSGEPQKPQSQTNLKALLDAGARRHPAQQSEIIKLLEAQSRAVGKNGILIVAFATHGVSDDGTQYLLTASSLLHHRETSVTEAKVRDIVSRNRVERSFILLDACRERLTRDRRNGDADPRSVAGLMSAMAPFSGQVVLSAASAGDYAYDDDVRGNGVFTAAVIDGLRCGAHKDAQGFVTVDTLSTFVEERVLSWIRDHKNPGARKATQLQCEGRSKNMPLSTCVTGTASRSRPRRQ